MARPRSEQKRKAILDAAMEVFAERGIANAPTAAISKVAGVAEGTLFTYFATKDELLNELSQDLREEFDRTLADFPHEADPQTRMRFVWDRFIELAKAKPTRLRVVKQLRSSGRLLNESNPSYAVKLLLSTAQEAAQGGPLSEAPAEFLVLLFRSHAEATIEYIGAHPEQEAASRELGLRLFLTGLSIR